MAVVPSLQRRKKKIIYVNVKKTIISGNFLGDETRPQIIKAVNNGNIAVVRKLLRAGINPNIRDENDQPLASIASCLGHITILDQLLERKADVNASSSDGRTALHVATKASHEDIVKKLLDAEASMSAITLSGLKPIDFAKYETPIWYILRNAEIKKMEQDAELACYLEVVAMRTRNNS